MLTQAIKKHFIVDYLQRLDEKTQDVEKFYVDRYVELKKNKKVIDSSISNSNLNFISFRSKDIGHNIIHCDILNGAEEKFKNIDEFVSEISNVDRRIKRRHISVLYNSKLHSQLEKRKFSVTGIVLAAKVQSSINNLKIKNDRSFYTRLMKRGDIDSVLEIEKIAHRTSMTSRVRNLNFNKARAFYQFLTRRKVAFVACDTRHNIVGVIGYSWDAYKCGYIMCIAVHPDFQRNGISKMLYLEVLKELKNKKIKYYFGTTTTAEVLTFAKSIKREPIGIIFEC